MDRAMMKKTHDTKKKKMKITSRNPLPPFKDWENEDEYKYMDNHTPELWAWEFLRRNPKYQEDWIRELSRWKKSISEKDPFRDLITPGCRPNENEPPQKLPFDQARAKYNFLEPEIIDPSIDNYRQAKDSDLPLFYLSGGLYVENEFGILQMVGIEKSEAVLLFDLNAPIEEQYKRVRKELLELQNEFLKNKKLKAPRNSGKSKFWKKYIRILDAYAQNIKPREIAKIICPDIQNDDPDFLGTKTIEKYYSLAQALTKKKYVKILQSPSYPK